MKTNTLEIQALLNRLKELCLINKKDIDKVQTELKAIKKEVNNIKRQTLKV